MRRGRVETVILAFVTHRIDIAPVCCTALGLGESFGRKGAPRNCDDLKAWIICLHRKSASPIQIRERFRFVASSLVAEPSTAGASKYIIQKPRSAKYMIAGGVTIPRDCSPLPLHVLQAPVELLFQLPASIGKKPWVQFSTFEVADVGCLPRSCSIRLPPLSISYCRPQLWCDLALAVRFRVRLSCGLS